MRPSCTGRSIKEVWHAQIHYVCVSFCLSSVFSRSFPAPCSPTSSNYNRTLLCLRCRLLYSPRKNYNWLLTISFMFLVNCNLMENFYPYINFEYLTNQLSILFNNKVSTNNCIKINEKASKNNRLLKKKTESKKRHFLITKKKQKVKFDISVFDNSPTDSCYKNVTLYSFIYVYFIFLLFIYIFKLNNQVITQCMCLCFQLIFI